VPTYGKIASVSTAAKRPKPYEEKQRTGRQESSPRSHRGKEKSSPGAKQKRKAEKNTAERGTSVLVEKLIDIKSEPVASLLDLLLADKSTRKNIIWATNTYEVLGPGFTDKEQMNRTLLLQHADLIRPRIEKSQEEQAARTRKKAEVFTPAWLCNLMNNYCDEAWFGRKDVFNHPNEDHTWTVNEEPVEFPKRKTWKRYVDSRRLEITCGEAPYLVSRYDSATGARILPLKKRIGLLDRKLRIVSENAANRGEWAKWALRAYEACYGYEYQGDSLLIARVNLLLTFCDYHQERWGQAPDIELLERPSSSGSSGTSGRWTVSRIPCRSASPTRRSRSFPSLRHHPRRERKGPLPWRSPAASRIGGGRNPSVTTRSNLALASRHSAL
jgi:hypothetical protein